MVHLRVTLVPAATPVMVVEGEAGVVMVAEPDIIVQFPVPITGLLAAIVNVEVLHNVWSGPADAVVGMASLVIMTSS